MVKVQRWMANSVVGGGYDEEDGERLQLEGESVHEREDNESLGQAPSSTNEDNAVNSDSDRPLSQYNNIDGDGVVC